MNSVTTKVAIMTIFVDPISSSLVGHVTLRISALVSLKKVLIFSNISTPIENVTKTVVPPPLDP
jgi:hypothetical protein